MAILIYGKSELVYEKALNMLLKTFSAIHRALWGSCGKYHPVLGKEPENVFLIIVPASEMEGYPIDQR